MIEGEIDTVFSDEEFQPVITSLTEDNSAE